jgi:hypothetical protein
MRLALTVCAVILGPFAITGPCCAQPNVDANLYRVRKIFLETQNTVVTKEDLSDGGMTESRSMHPPMRDALIRYGFVIVDDPADADAVFYGANTIGSVVLDGPQLDPPKYGFEFWLFSSKDNFKWKTKFDISTHASETEGARKATDRSVRNLFSAWKRSAKRAGLVVGDKVT